MSRSSSCRSVATLTLLLALPVEAQIGIPGAQFWSQATADIPVDEETFAWFGRALAAGDFDCDDYDDLAIAMPGQDVGAVPNTGSILVLFGTPAGLHAQGAEVWTQDIPSLQDDAEQNDHLGWRSMAAGDFDDDGCDDLAIGAPFEDVNGIGDAGAVVVIRGSPTGLTATGNAFIHEGLSLIPGDLEENDNFGWALAAADFDADDVDDLAIGVPGEEHEVWLNGVPPNTGALHVLFGEAGTGLVADDQRYYRAGSDPIDFPIFGEELLGYSVAAVPGSVRSYLWVGIPGGVVDGVAAGTAAWINNLPGLPQGGDLAKLYSQASTGVPGVPEEGDRFGEALAAGDFDGDGTSEVLAGVPGEGIGTGEGELVNAGAVNLIERSSTGGGDHQILTANHLVPDSAAAHHSFGAALAAGDFDGDGVDDAVISVPGANDGPAPAVGRIHVLYGVAGAPLGTGRHDTFLQTLDPPEPQSRFGFSLATGDFDGKGSLDLAVGSPFDDVDGVAETGSVTVLYAALFTDGFESGNTSAWSASLP